MNTNMNMDLETDMKTETDMDISKCMYTETGMYGYVLCMDIGMSIAMSLSVAVLFQRTKLTVHVFNG